MSQGPEVIVLGMGGMGSAAAWRLARTGARVRAFDPHPIGHALGSSHGETRMIRQAYFEHPDYVPLLKRAYDLWAELESESATKLFHRNGVVIYGPMEGGTILPAVEESARRHGLNLVPLDEAEARRRFPEYRPPESFRALLEPNAGYLEVENAVTQASLQAVKLGVELHLGERVLEWRPVGSGSVEVTTDRGTYRADRLVIAAGPWSAGLLGPDLGMKLEPRRVVQFWLRSRIARGPESLPCFGFELPYGFLYGFPLEPGVLKIAAHLPGAPVDAPETVNRALLPGDAEPVLRFVRECLPEATSEILRHSVCMYTMTVDQHFVIDLHPRSPLVSFAAGFSGHGFKFAPVIGEILADLALTGETRHPISFLRRR